MFSSPLMGEDEGGGNFVLSYTPHPYLPPQGGKEFLLKIRSKKARKIRPILHRAPTRERRFPPNRARED